LNIESSMPTWFTVGRQQPDGSITWIERDTVEDEEILIPGDARRRLE